MLVSVSMLYNDHTLTLNDVVCYMVWMRLIDAYVI